MCIPAAAVALGLGAISVLARSLRRVEVVGGSMAPALLPGDRLVVLGPHRSGSSGSHWPWPRSGQVVAVRDPGQPGRILVKRVTDVRRSEGTFAVEGDARHASTDSRAFGPLPRSALVGWVVYRYAPTARSGLRPGRTSTIGPDA